MNKIAVIIPIGPGHSEIALRAVNSVMLQSWYTTPLIVNDTGAAYTNKNWLQVATAGGEGVGTARQLGTEFAAAAGFDAVVYLDADDMLLPRAIEAMVATYTALKPAYVYGDGYNVINAAAGEVEYYRAADYDRRLYGYQNIHNVTALLPITTALAVRWTNDHWEDYIYYSGLALAGFCGARTPYPVIAYDLSAGARRNAAHAFGAEYARSLLTDYRRKFGLVKDKKAMGCCTPNTTLTASGVQMLAAGPDVVQPAGTVALGYTGVNAGPIEYRVNGRSYNAEAGGVVYAKPADVAALVGFGKFYELPPPPDADQVLADMIDQAANTENAEVDALIVELARGNAEAAALVEPTAEQAAVMAELGIAGAAAGAKLAENQAAEPMPGVITGYDQNIAALDQVNAREAAAIEQAAEVEPKPRQRRTRKPKS